MLKLKKKDWTAPDGEVIKGREILVEEYTPSDEELKAAYEKGFKHLTTGEFKWFLKEGKIIHVHTDTVESIEEK